MDAMDWHALFCGALWIAGLGLSLAAFSHLRWAAKQARVSLRTAVRWDSFLGPFFAGVVLFAGGMACSAWRAWETLAWLALAVIFAAQAGLSARNEMRRHKERSASHETHQ